MKNRAFTLAEVLVVLGIVGVISAMTIPILITNYQKHVVEAKLTRFYSIMNQALRLSAVDNGDPDGWIKLGRNFTYTENLNFLNTYLLPYMRYVKIEENPKRRNFVLIHFYDGSIFNFGVMAEGGDMDYYVNGKVERSPRNSFAFQLNKRKSQSSQDINSASYIEPYVFNWTGTVDDLRTNRDYACNRGCKDCAYCTKLIQLNSWKIPKDYPW